MNSLNLAHAIRRGAIHAKVFRNIREASVAVRARTITTGANAPRKLGNRFFGPSVALLLASGLYFGIAVYSLDHEDAYDIFEKYMPFGATVLDKLEDANHKKTIEIRKRYYEDNSGQILPYILRKTPSEAYSSSTSDSDQHDKTFKDDLEDPLSPERFFDAQSGTVSLERKEYLPLLLLPDIRNPLIGHISMSMNDLISSVNSSAASSSTVQKVVTDLNVLAEDIRSYHPKHARLLDAEVKELNSLVDTHEAIKQEYLLINPQSAIPHSLPFEMEYHNKLAREILKIERILVSHINRRHDRERDQDSVKQPAASSGVPQLSVSSLPRASSSGGSTSSGSVSSPLTSALPASSSSNTVSSSSSTGTQTPKKHSSSLFQIASSQDFEKILELQLQLTLIAAALHDNIGLPINNYVEQVKDTLKGCENRQELLDEAIKGVNIPADVDISETLEKILRN